MKRVGEFEVLTKYIDRLEGDSIGEFKGGLMEDNTITMPFVLYSRMVHSFVEELLDFCEKHPEFQHHSYYDVLRENGLKWDAESMENADVSDLDAKCIVCLLIGCVRADRFCEGALYHFFENGCIKKWLSRLSEIDNKQRLRTE